MEYCEGNTLKQLIDRGILQEKPNMIWMLLREILEGLKHMHLKVLAISIAIQFNLRFDTIGYYSSRSQTWQYSPGFDWTCQNR
jgi:serine/threonine protein kinase